MCDARTGIVAKNFFFSECAALPSRSRIANARRQQPGALPAHRRIRFCALSADACAPVAFLRAVSSVFCAASCAASACASFACAAATAVIFAAPVRRLATIKRASSPRSPAHWQALRPSPPHAPPFAPRARWPSLPRGTRARADRLRLLRHSRDQVLDGYGTVQRNGRDRVERRQASQRSSQWTIRRDRIERGKLPFDDIAVGGEQIPNCLAIPGFSSDDDRLGSDAPTLDGLPKRLIELRVGCRLRVCAAGNSQRCHTREPSLFV